jgi:uncharacterized protein YndB with AHSA1/START domain
MNATLNTKPLKEVTITRVFNAPRQLVWKAWTDEKMMSQWWGPHRFRNLVCEMDVKPGGKIRIKMDSPEFPDHWMTGTFLEIDEPNKLVFNSGAFLDENSNPQLEVMNTITFKEQNGKTEVTVHAAVTRATPAQAAAMAGMNEGWSQSLDRLDALLTGKPIL